jgi:hypothetical protein
LTTILSTSPPSQRATNSKIEASAYNRAVIAGAVLLTPTLVFWLLLLLYRAFGIGRPLMGALAGLEATQAGTVVMATIVIGCPFFALPLTVVGRWVARVNGQRGICLGAAVLALGVILLVLGLTLPLVLR